MQPIVLVLQRKEKQPAGPKGPTEQRLNYTSGPRGPTGAASTGCRTTS